jgi:regulation of enolase protein 1 (concanavalin A-like superfamily)
VKGAASYNVYRATAGETDLTKFTQVNPAATPLTGTTYTDPDLAAGQSYTYHIAPVTKDAEGKDVVGERVAVTASPIAGSKPEGYTVTSFDEDVNGTLGLAGCPSITGAVVDANGVITIRGSGNDIWNAADEFNFMSKEVKGNFTITVKALSKPSDTNEWAKAGLMIREKLTAGSRDAYLVLSSRQGLTFQWRDTEDGGAAWSNTRTIEAADLTPPLWIRMRRTGDEIVGEYSTDDGKTWLGGDLDENKITLDGLPETVHAGLAITAHDRGELSEAKFSDLKIE